MIDKNMKLTEHFTLKEMTASRRHPEIKNEPDPEQVMNLIEVCRWLEKLRTAYNDSYPRDDGKEQPIVISSGFRSKMLNYAVGGVSDSNHLDGCAADISCKDCTQAIRYATCLVGLFKAAEKQWDEIIVERRGIRFWLHFAVRPQRNRCKVTCIELPT